MKILHFTSFSEGGAAILMRRLHEGLRKRGFDSQIRFRHGNPSSKEEEIEDFELGKPGAFAERLQYSFENRLSGKSPKSRYSRLKNFHKTPLGHSDRDADIVHLHWVNRWIDLASLIESMSDQAVLFWTIHDMSPLAGGCFTDFSCDSFAAGCRCCPLLPWPFNRVLARAEVKARARALASGKVVAIANSQSTRRLLDQSEVFRGIEKHTIFPGIDFSNFEPLSRKKARRDLGISEDCLIVGFGAADLNDPNKGLDRFRSVANGLRDRVDACEALIFGGGEISLDAFQLPTHQLGQLSTPRQLNTALSAMDALIVTSEMESFGQISIEAQACGTPVWAFGVGGLPETMRSGVTGEILEFGDLKTMVQTIEATWREGRTETMGTEGRDFVRSRFELSKCVDRYEKLYRQKSGVRSIGNS